MTKTEARAKVAKLRALAQSANPHEARLANTRASELVEKYGLGPDTGMFSDPPYGLGTIGYVAEAARQRAVAFDAAIWADLTRSTTQAFESLANFADALRAGAAAVAPEDPNDPPK